MLARREKTCGDPWYSLRYVQVFIAIVVGVLVGYCYPRTGAG